MQIKTNQFGVVEFDSNLIIKFESGIFGFEQLKDYLLIKVDDDIFFWLNSIEEPGIAFPMIGLRMVDDSYPQEKEHEAFGIVNMNPDILKITVNLKAPVYINQDDKSGYQKILDSDKYPIKYSLFKE
ncbi:MAG: flagellar assembly protein FliW [Ignavibacteriaceae bacterium]|nr:flagellar assembly protein FliW [Ignavibacteriaceae bacterium]